VFRYLPAPAAFLRLALFICLMLWSCFSTASASEETVAPPVLQADVGPAEPDESLRVIEDHRIDFPLAVLDHPRVNYFLKLYTGQGKASFSQALARSGRYVQMMTETFRSEKLPQELIYLSLIESEFVPLAISPTKTAGLWQFTHGTGRTFGLQITPWVDERMDPIKSTRAAAIYLRKLHKQFGEWLWVVAAYNTGHEGAKRALKGASGASVSPLNPKIGLKPVTRDFVAKFIASALIARNPAAHGFGSVSYESQLTYDEVVLGKPFKLHAIAELARTTVQAIRKLNPGLLRNATPPQNLPFTLRLPTGRGGLLTDPHITVPRIPDIVEPEIEEALPEQPVLEFTPVATES
jgi:membrane-bound lytic murein transglycosylase D